MYRPANFKGRAKKGPGPAFSRFGCNGYVNGGRAGRVGNLFVCGCDGAYSRRRLRSRSLATREINLHVDRSCGTSVRSIEQPSYDNITKRGRSGARKNSMSWTYPGCSGGRTVLAGSVGSRERKNGPSTGSIRRYYLSFRSL